MDKQKENFKKLIDNHLIGTIVGDSSIETYRVTTENLINFLTKYFAIKRQGMDAIIEIGKNERP